MLIPLLLLPGLCNALFGSLLILGVPLLTSNLGLPSISLRLPILLPLSLLLLLSLFSTGGASCWLVVNCGAAIELLACRKAVLGNLDLTGGWPGIWLYSILLFLA